MGQSSKTIIDYAVYVLILAAVGLASYLYLKPAPEAKGPLKRRRAKSSESKPKDAGWNLKEVVGYDEYQYLLRLKREYSVNDSAAVAKQTHVLVERLGISLVGEFPRGEVIAGRQEVYEIEQSVAEAFVDSHLNTSSVVGELKQRLRRLLIELEMRNRHQQDVVGEDRCQETIRQLREEGVEDFMLRYWEFFYEQHHRKKGDEKAAIELVREAVEAEAIPPVRLRLAILWRRMNFTSTYITSKDEAVELVNCMQTATRDLVEGYGQIGWSATDCWREISLCFSEIPIEIRMFCLRDLWGRSDIAPYLQHVIYAYSAFELASEIRGEGWAADVPGDRWEAFEQLSELAANSYESAWYLEPYDRTVPQQLLWIAGRSGAGNLSASTWLSIALQSENSHAQACIGYAQFLVPRWGNDLLENIEFAEDCLGTGAIHSNVPLYGMGKLENYYYDQDAPEIWTHPRISEAVIQMAQKFQEYLQSEQGLAEPEHQYRRLRFTTLMLLLLNQKFSEIVELSTTMPGLRNEEWTPNLCRSPYFGREMIFALGGTHGASLSDLESMLVGRPHSVQQHHSDLLDTLIAEDEDGCRYYLAARRLQVQLLRNFAMGQATSIEGRMEFVWKTGDAVVDQLDDQKFRVSHAPGRPPEVVTQLDLILPEIYVLSAVLQVPEKGAVWGIRLIPDWKPPYQVGKTKPDPSGQFVELPDDATTVEVEIRVNGDQMACKVGGQSISVRTRGDADAKSSDATNFPIEFFSDMPLTISEVVVEPTH